MGAFILELAKRTAVRKLEFVRCRTHVFKTGVQFSSRAVNKASDSYSRRVSGGARHTRYHQSTYYLSPAKKRADAGTRRRWPPPLDHKDSSPSAAQRAPVPFKTT